MQPYGYQGFDRLSPNGHGNGHGLSGFGSLSPNGNGLKGSDWLQGDALA